MKPRNDKSYLSVKQKKEAFPNKSFGEPFITSVVNYRINRNKTFLSKKDIKIEGNYDLLEAFITLSLPFCGGCENNFV